MSEYIFSFPGNLTAINQKNFVFNNERFPVDFDALVRQSKYFRAHQSDYEEIDDILLIDQDKDLITLTPDIINKFIKACQNQPFKLLSAELPAFYYLASKFQVFNLINFIKSQLKGGNSKLSIELLLLKMRCKHFYEKQNFTNEDLIEFYNFKTNEEEEIVTEHFEEISTTDEFIKLPIHLLYRIFEKYLEHHLINENENIKNETKFDPNKIKYEEIDSNKIKTFLLKSLDEHGKPASILFSLINIENVQIDIINILLTKYRDIFNFNYINETLLKTVLELTSKVKELILSNEEETKRHEKQISEFIKEIRTSQEEMQNMITTSRNEINEIRASNEQNINRLKTNMEESITSYRNEINELRQNINELQARHSTENNEIVQSNKRMINEQRAQFRDELRNLRSEHQTAIDNLKIDIPNTFSIPKLDTNDSRGICKFLLYNKVDFSNTEGTIKVTGYPDSNDNQATLNKIVTEDNDDAWCSKTDPNAAIEFDFGQSSISFTAFKIWTGDDPVNGRHLKRIKILGSNDGDVWKDIAYWILSSLNGPNNKFDGVLNSQVSSFYRYLKLQLNGPNCHDTNELYLKRIEFFGNVKRLF